MIERQIDELLFRSESSDLDFKSAQYRFRGASDADICQAVLSLVLEARDAQ